MVSGVAKPHVLLSTEGTYPFHLGGVSTWCDTLVHQLPDIHFDIFAIAMNPYVSLRYAMPANVGQVIPVPLWGMQDPSEHRTDVIYSEIFLQKQRTDGEHVRALFLPPFQQFLRGLAGALPPGELGQALAAMYRYFRTYDYQVSFKTEQVWEVFKEWELQAAHRGLWDEPSVFEAVQSIGWIYHFLTVLNTSIPHVDVVHSSAAAFCGMVGIVSKLEYGTPYVLTEHGVYLREQYLSIGRSSMTPFSKRFLLALVKTIAKENLFYADELAPVCAFNGRWERVLGADPDKIRVIYNGVSSERFFPTALPDAAPPGSLVHVLAVARIDPNKDLVTLLRAMAIVKNFGISAKTVIQGSVSVPEYADKLEKLLRELGLEREVEFSGHTDDMTAVYRDADIVVQSSVTEAFPYSVIEAMMSGRPMVATDVGGTREALGDAGILVPSRDPALLAAGIAMLATNPALRRELGVLARARAVEKFEIRQTLAAFTDLYRRWSQRAPEVMGTGRANAQPEAVLRLQRAHALRALNQPLLALEQCALALDMVGSSPAATTLLLEMVDLEWRLGRLRQAEEHLIKAKMLEAFFAERGGLGQVG